MSKGWHERGPRTLYSWMMPHGFTISQTLWLPWGLSLSFEEGPRSWAYVCLHSSTISDPKDVHIASLYPSSHSHLMRTKLFLLLSYLSWRGYHCESAFWSPSFIFGWQRDECPIRVGWIFCSGTYFLFNLGMKMHKEYLSLSNTSFCQAAMYRKYLKKGPLF